MPKHIEELKDIIALVVEMVDCIAIVAKDGQLGFTDFGAVWSIVEKIGPAFVGADEVPGELKELTAADCDELIEYVMTELTTTEVAAKVTVDASLKAIKAAYVAYLAIKG